MACFRSLKFVTSLYELEWEEIMNAKLLHNRWLQHGAFWLLYLLYNSVKNMAFWPNFLDNLVTVSLIVPFIALAVYLNLYVFMPRFFKHKHYALYGVSTLTVLAILPAIMIQVLQAFFIFRNASHAVDTFSGFDGYFIWFTETFLVLAITTAIKNTKEWMAKEHYARALEKEKSEAEISFFKQQINPHFVFNALNSIYFAIPKSQELAQDIVMRLSEMLSHQLYDTNKDWIPLSKEAEYLKNYVEIERIRQGDALHLDCQLPDFYHNLKISPILLLPFVENAFKYATTADPSDYWVKIEMEVMDNQLHFKVENPYTEGKTTTHQKGGIGIINVQKRLNMIYPKKHKLRITQAKNIWKVELIMDLSELENLPAEAILAAK